MSTLPPAFVISHDPARLAQFRAAWRAVGLPDCVREWRACVMPSAPSLGNAVAQYALARHALASGLERVLVFEDDAVPREDAAALLPGFLADAAARGVHATAASHGIHGARGRFNADPRLNRIRASYAAAFSRALSNHP